MKSFTVNQFPTAYPKFLLKTYSDVVVVESDWEFKSAISLTALLILVTQESASLGHSFNWEKRWTWTQKDLENRWNNVEVR